MRRPSYSLIMPRAIAILAIDRSLEPDRARFAPELRHLLDALDPSQLHAPAPIPSSFQLLKRDDRGAVFRARMMNRDVVIKATVLSPLARLKSLARISKGWRHLRNAAWLETHAIPTARVLLLARAGRSELLIMDALPGRSLLHHLADPRRTPTADHALADAAGELVARVTHAGRCNRDHKPSNLIVTALRPPIAEISIIDCVGLIALGPLTRPIQGPLRMLSSMVIEPLGCNVLPRRALLMRTLRAYLRASWHLAEHPRAHRPLTSEPESYTFPIPISDEQRAWELASIRAFWSEITRTVLAHANPVPAINPLATPPALNTPIAPA